LLYQSNADGKISPPTASNTTSTPLPSVSFNTLLHKDSGLLISNEIKAPLSLTIDVFFSKRQAPITLSFKNRVPNYSFLFDTPINYYTLALHILAAISTAAKPKPPAAAVTKMVLSFFKFARRANPINAVA